jgi:4-hydroxy-2-oxoheptanedioate aldolase
MPRFRELLATDRLVRIFCLVRVIHPVVVDMFGLAKGFDGFWLDQEHGGLTYEQINMASVCARANGFDSFVRMAPTDYATVTQALEAGAGGVMAARIDSAAQAEEFVTWCKFAPRGSRGMNSQGCDADYSHKPPAQFCVEANRDNFVAIQIETLGALEQVDKIAAIDGVDLLFLGPSDMSQALGVVGQLGHEKVWSAYERVAAACRKHGKHWATISVDPAHVSRCVELGCRMMSFGSEVIELKYGIAAVKQAYADHF